MNFKIWLKSLFQGFSNIKDEFEFLALITYLLFWSSVPLASPTSEGGLVVVGVAMDDLRMEVVSVELTDFHNVVAEEFLWNVGTEAVVIGWLDPGVNLVTGNREIRDILVRIWGLSTEEEIEKSSWNIKPKRKSKFD